MLRLTTGRPEHENDRAVAEAFTFKHGCTFFCGFRSRMHPGARPGRLNEGTTFGICCMVGRALPITARAAREARYRSRGDPDFVSCVALEPDGDFQHGRPGSRSIRMITIRPWTQNTRVGPGQQFRYPSRLRLRSSRSCS